MTTHDPPNDTAQAPTHCPVMVPEVTEYLRPAPGESVLDLTAGTGGHTLALAQAVGAQGLDLGVCPHHD